MASKSKSLSAKNIILIVLIVAGGFAFVVLVPVTAIGFERDNAEAQEAIIEDAVDAIIDEGIDTGLLEIPFVCASVIECEEILDPVVKTPIEIIGDIQPVEIIEETPTIEPILNDTEGIIEVIEEIVEEIIEDEVIPEPEPEPEPPTIQIITKTIKTDNDGIETESITSSQFNLLLSFFVEDTSNIDFDNGSIEQSLSIQTDPEIMLRGSGQYDVLINGQSIFAEKINLIIDGTTFNDGTMPIGFISPTGFESPTFLFSFKDNLDKFPSGVSTLQFVLTDVEIQADNQMYSITNSTIFEMDIASDPNRIIITDEEANLVRAFPTDDRVIVKAIGANWKQLYHTSACCKYYTPNCQPATAMSGGLIIKILPDGTEQFIDTFPPSPIGKINNIQKAPYGRSCGSVIAYDSFLERNAVYRIDFNDPKGSVTFKTPESQQSYTFSCITTRDVTTTGASTLPPVCNYQNQNFIDELGATLGN